MRSREEKRKSVPTGPGPRFTAQGLCQWPPLSRPRCVGRRDRTAVGCMVGLDGCEVRLCDPCARVSRVCPGSPGVIIPPALVGSSLSAPLGRHVSQANGARADWPLFPKCGRPTKCGPKWPTFASRRHPQPKIAPQPDLTLSSALSGTPIIAAMLKGLTPRGLVLRCYPYS